ncbi:MAG: ABC transporter permease [Alphaproteobacteria bacterium]|nr:ABC transporter permease [Alphaproteobacteria bacterium]
MIGAILTVARRDFAATVFNKSFLLWLLMPLIFMTVSPLIGFFVGSQVARPGSSSVALVDPERRLEPHLIRAVDEARARAGYDDLRERFADLRPDTPFPEELAPPPDALQSPRLAELARPGALEALANRLDLDSKLGFGPSLSSFIPVIATVSADGDPAATAARLLRLDNGGDGARYAAVLLVDAGGERLVVGKGAVDVDRITRLVNDARQYRDAPAAIAVADAARKPLIVEKKVDRRADNERASRLLMANGAVFALFMLIAIMSQILLSNMVEEKANKVIEVLVASVPVPAIFAGKLIGMLAVSMVGLGVWGTAGAVVSAAIAPALPAGLLPTPAVGWPVFMLLAVGYFVTAYLIFGAVYLGIGSLCSSIREVQSLSMPATIVTTVTLILTISGAGNPDGGLASVLRVVPFSSPYMMLATAAVEPKFGFHALAMLWQLAFAALVVWQSSRLFRRGVLHAGPAPKLFGKKG